MSKYFPVSEYVADSDCAICDEPVDESDGYEWADELICETCYDRIESGVI